MVIFAILLMKKFFRYVEGVFLTLFFHCKNARKHCNCFGHFHSFNTCSPYMGIKSFSLVYFLSFLSYLKIKFNMKIIILLNSA